MILSSRGKNTLLKNNFLLATIAFIGGHDAAMHGSPYHYDAHVPLFFAGPGIPRQAVYRLVRPEDIAVTVALKLGIQAPPAASANALSKVLE